MGHLQDMSDEQRSKFLSYSYKRKLEEQRGHNFEYWNDKKHYDLIENKGWALVGFEGSFGLEDYTYSEIEAKEKVELLRQSNHFARIVCGYSKNVQKIKTFSVIYKLKESKDGK